MLQQELTARGNPVSWAARLSFHWQGCRGSSEGVPGGPAAALPRGAAQRRARQRAADLLGGLGGAGGRRLRSPPGAGALWVTCGLISCAA